MLNYFKMVCGESDLRYIKLASVVNKLCGNHILKINYDFNSLYENCVYNISTSELKMNDCGFGTAFKVKDFYITRTSHNHISTNNVGKLYKPLSHII